MTAEINAIPHFKMIKQGAEARIYSGTYLAKPTIIKERFIKTYRNPELDLLLTKERMKAEARAIVRCKSVGIITPSIYLVDFELRRIYMQQFVHSITAKDFISKIEQQNSDNSKKLLKILGELIGVCIGTMHHNKITHGDLTTSNILLINTSNVDHFDNLDDLSVSLIDFGLAHMESSAEDKGVDLYVLERAISSTHLCSDVILPSIFDGYRKANKNHREVIKKYDEVRARGRKRTMVG